MHKHRELRGLTAAGRKNRGVLKGHGGNNSIGRYHVSALAFLFLLSLSLYFVCVSASGTRSLLNHYLFFQRELQAARAGTTGSSTIPSNCVATVRPFMVDTVVVGCFSGRIFYHGYFLFVGENINDQKKCGLFSLFIAAK